MASLREYLNAKIKSKGSSLSAEKAKGKKYKSVSAAKKAGALYYTNKEGKLMAAVFAEDLKKPISKLAPKTSLKPKKRPKPKTKNPYTKPDRNGVDKPPKGTGFKVSPPSKTIDPLGQATAPDVKSGTAGRLQVIGNMKKITLKQWGALTQKQRKDVGLPTTKLQMRIYGSQNFKR